MSHTKPSRGARFGKAILWGTGLASLLGIARTIASPVRDLATDTEEGIRRRTPSLRNARASWQLETRESPEDLFAGYAKKMDLTETARVRMLRQYEVLTWFGVAAMLGSLVIVWWNISGLLLSALSGLFTIACAYRRDSLRYQRLPTFGKWLRERMWWIFG